jgi:CubicO group peptidase (beta-lactamase class C family)
VIHRLSIPGLLAALLCSCVAPPIEPSRQEEFNAIVRPLLEKHKNMGFAVGVIQGDRMSVLGYGRIALDNPAPPNGETVYEIGSITKVFTTYLLADLAREGIVALNDPISRHLPRNVKTPREEEREITLEDLATHTSGLPRLPSNLSSGMVDPYADYGPERLYEFLGSYRLKRAIGSKCEYSNLGVGLLGHLLERAAKAPYDELVARRIAGRIGMKATGITLPDPVNARLAPPYLPGGRPAKNWHFKALAGAGAIRSTANDLLKFVSVNLGRGEPAVVDAFASCHAVRVEPERDRLRVGLGWHLSPVRPKGPWATWHNGGTEGYSSFLGFVKESRTGVVVLSNTYTEATDRIGFEILSKLNP